ncbi:hypothetical protein ACFWIQ_03025 [Kitasatospora sp. NPDC127059]|uniref:hypothetical protein n=1 Tax=unclassified Kitasatospora TaxID=2633591 RepID=UPI003648F4E0
MAVFRKPGRFTWPGRPDPGAPGAEPAPPGTALADDAVARAGPATDEGLAEGLAELVEEAERPTGAWRVAEYQAERGRGRALVAGAARRLGSGGRLAARGAALGGKALAEQLIRTAPRIPVRGLATLRAQHPEAADPEGLADLLVAGATRASAALGAGVGAAAMLPVPPAMPVEIAAETLAVAAVEVKLIAELHEVYGVPAQGSATQRAGAYLGAWANRRGIDAMLLARPAGFAALALGAEVRQQVRRRLTRSWMRRLPSMTPLLLGAGIGATVNRRDTRRLAGQVRDDLRSRRPMNSGYWAAAGPALEGEAIP